MSGHSGQTAEPPPVNAGGVPVKQFHNMLMVTPAPPLMAPLVPSAAKKLRVPARDGYESVGKRVLIKANHFLVGIGSKDPHQYVVTIDPEVTSKTKSRDIMKFLSDSYGASHLGNLLLAYDGKKSAFAAGPLPFDSKEFVVSLTEQNGREREFKVTIKFAARKEFDLTRQFLAGRQQDNPQETIQALDVVLQESAFKDREIVGRSLFHTDFGRGPLGDGIEYWKGFYQSLRPTQMGLSLNIDMSARAFYEPKLLSEFVGEFLCRDMSRPVSDQERIKVTIAPEVTSKTKSRYIIKFLSDSYGPSHFGNLLLASDGKKSAFAAGPLLFDSKAFVVNLTEQNGREREFKVTIKFATRKELDHLRQFLAGRQEDNPQETIQALDVVLRESASKDCEIVGRSLFRTDFGRGPLGDGIEYWKGFYQSFRPTQMGLSLNIDMSARAFYEPKLLSEFVGEFLQREMSRPLSDQERIKVKRALKGVRVEVPRQNYERWYKVQALTAQPISQLNFIYETGSTKTVVQYFREKYNVQLRFPALPAVQAGTDAKPTYLPMKICWVVLVPGQRYALKLNERQVTQFLRATCQRPKDKEDSIDNTMKHNKYNKDPLVSKDFEMNVTELLTSIEAQVLPPPPLRYHESGRSSEVHPSVGVWNMIDLKVINGGTVNYWAVINFSRQNEQAVGSFGNGLVSMCQTKGIVFNPQPLIKMMHAAPHNIEKALVHLQSQCSAQLAKSAPDHHLQMLFVILPEAKGTYPRIKRVCETELGIVSQCCKPQHIMKMSNQYFENVALKINVKVGGRYTVLSATLNGRLPYVIDRPTIIFGADVTHPQPGEDSSPSIAAVVASMDWTQVTKYKTLVSAQPHRQEIINDLYTTSTDPKRGLIHGGLIRELLISFKRSTGHKPHRIIFYRDGVSEGQFNEVLLNEMDKIRKACISLEENYMPPMTFIVVQKRHHTCFFPVRHGDRASTDMSGNILPDTVVDTKICHPSEFDFYLCSHAGIQGTSRPTHYHVLYDVNKFTADGLQTLRNSLCYTFVDETGATKTVVQYLREKYNVQLRFPALHAIQAGTDAKPTYLSMEVLDAKPTYLFSFFGGGGPKRKYDTDEPSTSTNNKRRQQVDISSVSKLIPRTFRGTLLERIDRNGFEHIPVKGDGSCQYRSLSVAIHGREDKYMEVKDEIITEIEGNPELYREYGLVMGMRACRWKNSYDKFVRGLNEPDAWGNLMTLFAFTNVFTRYHVRATLVCSVAGEPDYVMQEVTPMDMRITKDVYVSYIKYNKNDAHYDCLRKLPALSLRQPNPPRNLGPFELVVKNLPLFVSNLDLASYFMAFGVVRNAWVMSRHGVHRGVGLVRMVGDYGLQEAVRHANGRPWPRGRNDKAMEVTIVSVDPFEVLGEINGDNWWAPFRGWVGRDQAR